MQYAALESGYVDAIAAHEEAITQYMEDYGADFRFLAPPLLTTGIGVAFSNNEYPRAGGGADQNAGRNAAGRHNACDREQIHRASGELFGGGDPWTLRRTSLLPRGRFG